MIPTIVFTHRTDLRGPDETSHGQAAVHDRAARPAGAALPAGTDSAGMPGRPTTSIRGLAARNHIPVVGVTETIQPRGASFEQWFSRELAALQQALNQGAP
jgi:hypothetical protein